MTGCLPPAPPEDSVGPHPRNVVLYMTESGPVHHGMVLELTAFPHGTLWSNEKSRLRGAIGYQERNVECSALQCSSLCIQAWVHHGCTERYVGPLLLMPRTPYRAGKAMDFRTRLPSCPDYLQSETSVGFSNLANDSNACLAKGPMSSPYFSGPFPSKTSIDIQPLKPVFNTARVKS